MPPTDSTEDEVDPISGHAPRITVGDRVIYRGNGSYNGRRGRVEDIFGGHAKVQFRSSTLIEPLANFEPIEIVHEIEDRDDNGGTA